MTNINDYLNERILITDGAMGTYYSTITGDDVSFCEIANIKNPEVIEKIHREYITAGAKLIRTNTFSANAKTLQLSREEVKEIISKGYDIGKKAIGDEKIFLAASIGPIPDTEEDSGVDILEEYKFIVDCFLEKGADIFIFETFSSLNYIKEITGYIKQKNKYNFIINQFAFTADGFTREGMSLKTFLQGVEKLKDIDVYGFNCGSGPTHLLNLLKGYDFKDKLVSVLPNAGYPELINERTVYVNNPVYFSEKMLEFKSLGFRVIGGCCGTTPEHIKSLNFSLFHGKDETNLKQNLTVTKEIKKNKESNNFLKKLNNGEFVIAVELDPPFDNSIEKIMKGAKVSFDNGVDLITIADSPMSKVRVDSVIIASKIKREIGIEVMPHICCRDKNMNALRSGILGAHIENIRNILAVTGDPIAITEKMEAKNVFNLNSFKLIELMKNMNEEVFCEDEINIGGAFNPNVLKPELEISRMYKKSDNGARFFLTQPIYDDKAIQVLKRIKHEGRVKILGGILPIVSYKNAQFLNNELPGVHIPQEYMSKFSQDMSREEAEEIGIELSVEIINKMKEHVNGIYLITPFNRIEMIMKIIERIG